MSNTDLTRRGLLKSSILGAAAAGAAGFGMTATAEAAPAKKMSGTYDAIVLGAGPAGLIAAITAHDMGAKVCVMEKCDRPDGNAIYALGSVCGWGTRHQKEQGITDTADAFYAMMMDISKQMGDPALTAPTPTTFPQALTGSKRISALSSARSVRCLIRVSAAPAAWWVIRARA